MTLYTKGGGPAGIESDGSGRVSVGYVTASTNWTNGAFTVLGGVGIGGNLNVNYSATINGLCSVGGFTCLGDSYFYGTTQLIGRVGLLGTGMNTLDFGAVAYGNETTIVGDHAPAEIASNPAGGKCRGWLRVLVDHNPAFLPYW